MSDTLFWMSVPWTEQKVRVSSSWSPKTDRLPSRMVHRQAWSVVLLLQSRRDWKDIPTRKCTRPSSDRKLSVAPSSVSSNQSLGEIVMVAFWYMTPSLFRSADTLERQNPQDP